MDKNSVNRGRQLKFVREYRGFSYSDICNKKNNVSESDLSRFEQGFEKCINKKDIYDIMTLLKWPIAFLDKKATCIELVHSF